jgi:hypothetical protein
MNGYVTLGLHATRDSRMKHSVHLTLAAFLISTPALGADDKAMNLGVSSFAIILSTDYAVDDDFSGAALTGSYATNDEVRFKGSLYSTEHDVLSGFENNGFTLSVQFGKGFKSQGFGWYGNLGFYTETWKLLDFSEDFTGLEFGGGIAYNWEDVSIDWGLFNFRSTGDYDEFTEVPVTAVSGNLGISARF